MTARPSRQLRILWVTNDLPPRAGGIQQFVANLLGRVHPTSTVVVGPAGGLDGAVHDDRQPYRTVRHSGPILPTPQVARLAVEVGRLHRPDVVVLGAAWPLGELAPTLGRALRAPVVALSHGLEAGIAQAGGGWLLARATRGLAAVTTISGWTEERLRPYLRASRHARLPPGVDVARFRPDVDGTDARRGWGIRGDVQLVGCISRLVPRKGQDQLLAAWPGLRRRHPDAILALVGDGPAGPELAKRVAALEPDPGVVLAGPVPWDALPASHAALDVFAMPCRTRWGGLDVEGLGIVYLEAQASGVPAIAGRSGGAPEAVVDGVTGTVVDGQDPRELVDALDHWLSDPAARAAAGRAGRREVERRWSWTTIADRFAALLDEVVTTGRPDVG